MSLWAHVPHCIKLAPFFFFFFSAPTSQTVQQWLSPTTGICVGICDPEMHNPDIHLAFLCGPESTAAWLKAHSTIASPLSEDSSHQAENDKYSKSGFVLDISICRLELQLSLVAMVFAHSETGSSVGRQIKNKKKIRIYDAESPPTLWKWTIRCHSAKLINCIFFIFYYGHLHPTRGYVSVEKATRFWWRNQHVQSSLIVLMKRNISSLLSSSAIWSLTISTATKCKASSHGRIQAWGLIRARAKQRTQRPDKMPLLIWCLLAAN